MPKNELIEYSISLKKMDDGEIGKEAAKYFSAKQIAIICEMIRRVSMVDA